MIDFNIPVEEEILYLANAMTEEARKKMFLANAGFVSDAQRKAVMAKFRDGEGGGGKSIYGDDTSLFEKEMYGKGGMSVSDDVTDEELRAIQEKYPNLHVHRRSDFTRDMEQWKKQKISEYVGLNKGAPVSQNEFDHLMKDFYKQDKIKCPGDKATWYKAYQNFLANRKSVEEEIIERALYLANKELTDEQRKAIFAKNGGGGGGGGGNRQQVYYRGSPNGGSGGNGGSSGGNTGGRTVQTTRNAGSGGGSHYTQAGDLTSSWVTSLSPQQMAEEYKNDPERLKKAIQEQINAGAYMGISINGHEPSVMDIINGGIAPNYTKPIEVKNLSERDFYAQKNDPMAGAEAIAIDPMTGKPMQEEQGSWEHLSPTQQVEQDITGGTTASGSGTVQPSTTPGGNYTVTPSTGGGTTTGAGDVGGAIETIDLSGNTGGPTAAEIAAANLSVFQQALAHAHF